jgi:FKBP-type peptidyl-prolyl cis-trans isomerase
MGVKMKTRILALAGTLIVIAAAVSLILRPRKPKSLKEQVSYAIGVKFGQSLRAQKLDLNSSQVGSGINDGLTTDQLLLNEAEMQSAIKQVADKQQREIVDQAEKNKAVAESFLEKNKNAPGVKVTDSGLQYKMLEEGRGDHPTTSDVVAIKFYNYVAEANASEPPFNPTTQANVAVNGVIPGWSEGLQLMKKGGKAIFYVPPALGYGDRPRQGVPSNATQVFQVEMLDIQKAAPQPKTKTTKK